MRCAIYLEYIDPDTGHYDGTATFDSPASAFVWLRHQRQDTEVITFIMKIGRAP